MSIARFDSVFSSRRRNTDSRHSLNEDFFHRCAQAKLPKVKNAAGSFRSAAPKKKKTIRAQDVNVKFKDIIGMEDAKKEAWEVVQLLKDRTRVNKTRQGAAEVQAFNLIISRLTLKF